MTTQTMQGAPARLTILYDETCALCRRARDWLLTQPCLVEVELLPAGSAEARTRYGALPWLGAELVAVDDRGNAWVGPPAFLACMWATRRYRTWAFRLSRPSLMPRAEQFFRWVSRRRDRFGSWIDDDGCSWCEQETAPAAPPVRSPRPPVPVAQQAIVRCGSGHEMPPGARFCRVCGLARPGLA